MKLRLTYAVQHDGDINPSRPNPGPREKIKLNFYFDTYLWCLKRFYEGLKGLKELVFERVLSFL